MSNSPPSPAERRKIVQAAIKSFLIDDEALLFSEQNLKKYLDNTEQLGWDRSGRLLGLASGVANKFGWAKMCQLYELILQAEQTSDQIGTFIAWQTDAFRYLDNKNQSLAKAEQISVCEDTERVLNRALIVSPKNPGLSTSLGVLYQRYSRCHSERDVYLKKAIRYFEQAECWSNGSDYEDQWLINFGLAMCHFDLEEWSKALEAFKRLDLDRLREEMGDVETEDVDRRLKHCQSISS